MHCPMGSTSEEEYAAFQERVKRTVYVDSLSPQVTETVLKSAFNQFGVVLNVKFIPNYLGARNTPCCALVEMKEEKEAKAIVSEMSHFLFMVAGMPRPVRVHPAKEEMFDDRVAEPGRRINIRWLEPNDPDFKVAKELKQLTRKHAAEASFLRKNQAGREEQLHKQQAETLKANYRKYELIEGILGDSSAQCLAEHYQMRLPGDS